LSEIQNPNQQGSGGGGDFRSVMTITVVFVAIFLLVQQFMKKDEHNTPATQPAPTAQSQSTAQQQPSQQPASTPYVPATAAAAVNTPTAAPAQPAIVAAGESNIVVESELYRITFSNRGADVKQWILKKYQDSNGKPFDLVNQAAAQKFGYPLSLFTYDAGLRSELNNLLYVPSATTLTAPGTLTFRYRDGAFDVTKSFHFDSNYVLHADYEVKFHGLPVTSLLAWPGGLGDQVVQANFAAGQFASYLGGKSDTTRAKSLINGATFNQSYDYAGVGDLYFEAIFLPDSPENTLFVTFNNSMDAPRDPHNLSGQHDPTNVIGTAAGDQRGTSHLRLFAGPKQLDVLANVHALSGVTLEPTVQFGWLTIIAKPLFLGLRWVYEHGVSSWGWAIIIVTTIFNLAMLPTRLMMMKSSLKMSRIQPQMDAIKARYKNMKVTDPRRQNMNQEIFALQKKEGINMFGGCLPMLVQMPLFFAFYRVLANVIELRQSHWGWLPDLAVPDPYYILPIIIIVCMFLVQFLTPPSPGMDPAQQRMMAFMMPAIFGFSMINFASGLALYWGTGQVINLVMQVFINRSTMGREMRKLAAARAKQKATGKIINARR
jgi:YidC/Oxa1 family membrane protein insertase